MSTIIFVGKIQSGKSSSCNLLMGEKMLREGLLPEYKMNEKGELVIPVLNNGEVVWGVFDHTRLDYEFVSWCSRNLWPKVRIFNFADPLKQSVSSLFGVPLSKVYGTNEDKDSLTTIKGSVFGKDDEYLTVRGLLWEFAILCRNIDENCFARSTLDSIARQNSDLSLIGDCRFENEIIKGKEAGAKIVKLNRSPIKNEYTEDHLDDIPDGIYDLIIEEDVSFEEKNRILIEKAEEWGAL